METIFTKKMTWIKQAMINSHRLKKAIVREYRHLRGSLKLNKQKGKN